MGLASGPLTWRPDSLRDCHVPEGGALVLAARIEPTASPGAVTVTETVKGLAGETDYSYFDLGQRKLPKQSGTISLFSASHRGEGFSVDNLPGYPLQDEQYYRRLEAFQRFVYMWLMFDQLPRGSWGRSTPGWMNAVWQDVPHIVPNPVMDHEGGFETTIFNLEILSRLLGPERLYQMQGSRAFQYLRERHTPRGFGTLSLSRNGYAVEPHPRHTALVGWLIGTVLGQVGHDVPELRELFQTSVAALFLEAPGGRPTALHLDRNPLLLYLCAWHVTRAIETALWEGCFTPEQRSHVCDAWEGMRSALLDRALTGQYSRPEPSQLPRGRLSLFPLTIPYGQFVRMEAYSLLTAAPLLHQTMPANLLDRVRKAIEFIVEDYLSTWSKAIRCAHKDALQPIHASPSAFLSDDGNPHPDLGIAALLLRTLRDANLCACLWNDAPAEKVLIARQHLIEDLTLLFDRWLVAPELFDLTHPGMLASALVHDHPDLHEKLISSCRQAVTPHPPTRLADNSIEAVLSEHRIARAIREVVASDGLSPAIQISEYSLQRLLLDRLRPGLYVEERLGTNGTMTVARKTLDVYQRASFVRRYKHVWEDRADRTTLALFMSLLPSAGCILDVGCGVGQYAAEMVRDGHRVDLLDGSSPLLSIARDRVRAASGASFECFNVDILNETSRSHVPASPKYDAIWCSGTLAHVPQNVQKTVLLWLKDLVKDGGKLFLSTPIRDSRVIARDGRFYAYIESTDRLRELAVESGFRVDYALEKEEFTNTYGEPKLTSKWANLYCTKKAVEAAGGRAELEVALTRQAYGQSASDFFEVHVRRAGDSRRQRVLDSYIDKTLSLIPSVKRPTILDAGCGAGDYLFEMARRGCSVVGIDLAEEMLELANERCAESIEKGDVELRMRDIRNLPNEWDGRFQGVLCVTAFQHIPLAKDSALDVLRGFHRVLVPRGVLLVDAQLGRGTGFDPDLRFIQGYETPGQLEEVLKQGGFQVIEMPRWSLKRAHNTYQRDTRLDFVQAWARRA